MKTYKEYLNENIDWNQKLIYSSYKGDLKGVIKTIKQGADVSIDNYNILLAAIEYDKDDMLEYLCEYIILNKPQDIKEIIKYIPKKIKNKYPEIIAASEMDLI